MMLPAGKEKICLKSSVISAVVNIVLNLILIPIWGLNAAAVTTAISEFLGIIIKRPYIDREIRIDGLKQMFAAPVAGSLCIVAVSIVVRCFIESPYLIAILTILLSGIVYFAILVLMKNEFVMNFLKPVISKLKRS